jgi:hypothetical protein
MSKAWINVFNVERTASRPFGGWGGAIVDTDRGVGKVCGTRWDRVGRRVTEAVVKDEPDHQRTF